MLVHVFFINTNVLLVIPGKEEEMPGMLFLLVGEKGNKLKNERVALHMYIL